jgi:hypothetical protein
MAAVVFSLVALLLTRLFSFLVLGWDGLDGAAVPKQASENGAYTPQVMSLTCLSNSANLEATG